MAERSIAADCKSARVSRTVVRIHLPPPLLLLLSKSSFKVTLPLHTILTLSSKWIQNQVFLKFMTKESRKISERIIQSHT